MKSLYFALFVVLAVPSLHAKVIHSFEQPKEDAMQTEKNKQEQQAEEKLLMEDNHGFEKKKYQRRYRSKAVREVIPDGQAFPND